MHQQSTRSGLAAPKILTPLATVATILLGSLGTSLTAQSQELLYGPEESVPLDSLPGKCFAAGDFDGDHLVDVFAGQQASSFGGTDHIYFQTDNGKYRLYQPAVLQHPANANSGSTTTRAWVRDFDGDGDLDILRLNYALTTGWWWYTVELLTNDGLGNFTRNQSLYVQTMYVRPELRVADLNADGTDDVLIGYFDYWYIHLQKGYAFGTPCVYVSDGKGNYKRQAVYTGACVVTGMAVADFDGDGNKDAAFTMKPVTYYGYPGNYVYRSRSEPLFLLNRGKQAWVDGSQQVQIPVDLDLPRTLGVDLDGDGDDELVVTRPGNGSIRLLENKGKGNFEELPDGLLPQLGGSQIGLHTFQPRSASRPKLLIHYRDSQSNEAFSICSAAKEYACPLTPRSTWLAGSVTHYAPRLQRFFDIDQDGDLDLVYDDSKGSPTIRFRRGLTHELYTTEPHLGKPWHLTLSRRPRALPRNNLGIVAISSQRSSQLLQIPAVGSWSLPLGLTAWLPHQTLPAPQGFTTWTLTLPSAQSFLGLPLFTQALAYDPSLGWRSTRAIHQSILP